MNMVSEWFPRNTKRILRTQRGFTVFYRIRRTRNKRRRAHRQRGTRRDRARPLPLRGAHQRRKRAGIKMICKRSTRIKNAYKERSLMEANRLSVELGPVRFVS